MEITSLEIGDVKLIRPRKHGDNRGFFSETYKRSALRSAGIEVDFEQDNHSMSAMIGTLRGLHFQIPPHAQAKLVRVVRGAILDVVVDIRVGSPTFGRHVSAIISTNAWNQIYVPIGFAHGLLTLEPDTEVLYKVSAEYAPESDRGLLWNDPEIGIDWGIDHSDAILSEKDERHPSLADLPEYFRFEG